MMLIHLSKISLSAILMLLINSAMMFSDKVSAQTSCSTPITEQLITPSGDAGVTLNYILDVEDESTGQGTFTAEVIHSGVGYVGLGVSNSGLMVPGVAVMGFGADNVFKFDLEAPRVVEASPAQTLVEQSFEQNSTHSILRFKKLLIEPNEPSINPAPTITNVLWAFGRDNTFRRHVERGSVPLQLVGCDRSIPPEEEEDEDSVGDCSDLSGSSTFQRLENDLGGVSMEYIINVDDKATGQGTFTAEVIAEGTRWVGLGFSFDGKMIPGVAVIGGFGEVEKYRLSGKEPAGVQPASQQGLEDTSFVQNGTHSILRFTKLLEEPNDPIIVPGALNNVIWAYGTDNTFSRHENRGSASIILTECGGRAPPPTPLGPTPGPSPAPSPPPTLSAAPSVEIADCNVFQDTEVLANGDITMNYVVQLDNAESTNGFLKVELVCECDAWLGMGFTETQGSMTPSEAVIGLPDEGEVTGVGKYALTARSRSGVNLVASQTLVNQSIVQNDTHTVLSFSKRLIEPNEVPIRTEETNTFLWAFGGSNALGIHEDRGAFRVNLRGCAPGVGFIGGGDVDRDIGELESPGTFQSLWSAHGLLASVAWGLLSPCAIASSLLRDYIPKDGLWFKLHMFLNMTVFAFTFLAFIFAVTAVQKSTPAGSSPDHFQKVTHRIVGLCIMILVMIQALGGILRPHPPQKRKDSDEMEEKKKPRLIWEILHKGSGYGLLGLTWWEVQEGLRLYAERFQTDDLRPVFWGVTGSIVCITITLFVLKKFFNARK